MTDYLSAVIGYLRPRLSYPVGETADAGGLAVTLAGGELDGDYLGGAAELRALLDLTAFAPSQLAALRMLHEAHTALQGLPTDYEWPQYRFRALGATVESLPAAADVSPSGTYAVESSIGVNCDDGTTATEVDLWESESDNAALRHTGTARVDGDHVVLDVGATGAGIRVETVRITDAAILIQIPAAVAPAPAGPQIPGWTVPEGRTADMAFAATTAAHGFHVAGFYVTPDRGGGDEPEAGGDPIFGPDDATISRLVITQGSELLCNAAGTAAFGDYCRQPDLMVDIQTPIGRASWVSSERIATAGSAFCRWTLTQDVARVLAFGGNSRIVVAFTFPAETTTTTPTGDVDALPAAHAFYLRQPSTGRVWSIPTARLVQQAPYWTMARTGTRTEIGSDLGMEMLLLDASNPAVRADTQTEIV